LRPERRRNARSNFHPDRQKKQLKDRIGACLQDTNPGQDHSSRGVDCFGSLYSRHECRCVAQAFAAGEKKERPQLFRGQSSASRSLALINDPQILFSTNQPRTRPELRLSSRLDRGYAPKAHDSSHDASKKPSALRSRRHHRRRANHRLGTPRELQDKSANQSAIEVKLSRPLKEIALPQWPESIRAIVSEDRHRITVYSNRPARTLVEMVKWIDSNGFELDDIHLSRPTLEDVFIELTGKKLRD
jgi:ABC-2 type transport system ATP-binding protein